MTPKIHDFIAIGIGPFNLGLACLTAPLKELDGVFLDKMKKFEWHTGMLLQDTTLQIPFLADLVTLADPTNPFSFLNYAKESGRIYSFYIRENFLLLRNEYNLYCQWALSKLSNVHLSTQVETIHYDEKAKYYVVTAKDNKSSDVKIYRSKKLVLGTGTSPYVPHCCKHLVGTAIHSASYLQHKKELQTKKSITLVGSGQSAAEIYYDLLQEIDVYGYELHWITRSPRFFPLEYSKLTLEMTSPEYVDYFYSLPSQKRDQLSKQHKGLYKGINNDLIGAIYDCLYTKRLTNTINVSLRTNSELKKVHYDNAKGYFDLEFEQVEQGKNYKHQTSALVLATGYSYQQPAFLDEIKERIKWDDKGRYDVNRNYSIDKKGNEIFVQNAELHSHGFVTPDLGMGCYRNSYIINELVGKEVYPIEKRIAFQEFAVKDEETVDCIETALV